MAIKSRYSPLSRPNFENIYNAFVELSPRDQLIAAGIGGLLIVLIVILPLSMVSGKIGDLKQGISRSQGKFYTVFEKVDEYRLIQMEKKSLEKKFDRRISAMSTAVESLTRKTGLQGNIEALKEKPSIPGDRFTEYPVELKLRGLTLKKLVEFIREVETYPNGILRIRSLQVKPRYSNRAFLDISMDIASITLGGEA